MIAAIGLTVLAVAATIIAGAFVCVVLAIVVDWRMARRAGRR